MHILISKLKTETGSHDSEFLCNGYVTELTFFLQVIDYKNYFM